MIAVVSDVAFGNYETYRDLCNVVILNAAMEL